MTLEEMLKKCTKKELIEVILIYKGKVLTDEAFKSAVACHKIKNIGIEVQKNLRENRRLTNKLKSDKIKDVEKQAIYLRYLDNDKQWSKLSEELDLWEKELHKGEDENDR